MEIQHSLLNEVHLEDCVEFTRRLPNESVDLVIADPPYNIGKNFGNNHDSWPTPGHWVAWCSEWLRECYRILKPTGSIFVYSIHNYHCYIQCHLYELGFSYRRMIIWHYENGWAGFNKTLSAHYEPLLWFSKSKEYTYRIIREPYKSSERLKHTITKNGKVWKPNPEGRMAGDVWRFPTLAGRRFREEKVDHPTQKPMALTNRIVEHFSNPGDLIFIPFAGSGSECVSAKLNKRNFIATEINPDYVELAKKRLREVKKKATQELLGL